MFGWIKYFRHLFPAVGSGQLSVRKGDAGRPESLVRFGFLGFVLKAYLTAFGSATAGEKTSTRSFPMIRASAQCHFRSAPAIANSSNFSPAWIFKPAPTFLNVR